MFISRMGGWNDQAVNGESSAVAAPHPHTHGGGGWLHCCPSTHTTLTCKHTQKYEFITRYSLTHTYTAVLKLPFFWIWKRSVKWLISWGLHYRLIAVSRLWAAAQYSTLLLTTCCSVGWIPACYTVNRVVLTWPNCPVSCAWNIKLDVAVARSKVASDSSFWQRIVSQQVCMPLLLHSILHSPHSSPPQPHCCSAMLANYPLLHVMSLLSACLPTLSTCWPFCCCSVSIH